jgi:hypothetical protein
MNDFYIGGYHNGYFVSDPGTYMLIDELKISNSRIGTPSGFTGSAALSPPQNIRAILPQ